MERKKEYGGEGKGKRIQRKKNKIKKIKHELSDKCYAINFHVLMPFSFQPVSISDVF